jgi:hypothetical protein
VQVVNIRSHVPILLDMAEPNYNQWRCFFDSILGKFGPEDHVLSPPPLGAPDAEWRMQYTRLQQNRQQGRLQLALH